MHDYPKNTFTYTPTQSNGDIRLDRVLIAQFPTFSRTYFQELIVDGLVTINESVVNKSNHRVRAGSQVGVLFKTKEYNLAPTAVDFEVIDEQPDFLIINKPAGLLVHHAASTPDEVSLVNGLLHRYPDMQGIDTTNRPGIVHRLDKHTTGLIIVARNHEAQIALSNAFKERQMHKTYLAIVTGTPLATGSIALPIGRHPRERQKMATFGIDVRPALTHYTVLEQYKEHAIVSVRLITGRTHQIRVHFAALGHSLVGDSVYGRASDLIARQALHAWQLSFTFKGQSFSYTAPLPDDLQALQRTFACKN